jgi:hypothetical protein
MLTFLGGKFDARCTAQVAILLAIIALLVCGSGRADEAPAPFLKDGLWQTSSTRTSAGKTTQLSAKTCENHQTQQDGHEMAQTLRKRFQCTMKVSQPSAGVYVTADRCAAGPNAGAVTKITEAYKANSYRIEQHRMVGSQDNVMIVEGKYLGACPADMKPGDTVLPDGSKMNYKDP